MTARAGMKRLLSLWLLCACLAGWAQGLQPVPALTARVIDQTGTLGDIERQGLEDKLAAMEKARGSQLVFLIVATTQPEDIAAYANRVANAWKIGRRDVGDGVLLVVAKNDRKVRIEVAKTLEGAIPDLAARQIIDTALTPQFRKGDYTAGLGMAADQIAARIAGEALPAPTPEKSHSIGSFLQQGFQWTDMAIFLFFAVPVAGAMLRAIFGRKLGALVTGGGVGAVALFITSSVVVAVIAGIVALLFVLLSSLNLPTGGPRAGRGGRTSGGWSSGSDGGSWSSSSDSGGFSSGGGGDFGGGGASGDW